MNHLLLIQHNLITKDNGQHVLGMFHQQCSYFKSTKELTIPLSIILKSSFEYN